jgi:invasion protein IalB
VNETTCALNQTLFRSSDKAFLAQMLAFSSGDGSKRYLLARVPVGAYLPSGFAMRAESDEDVIPFVWQACSQTQCEALVELDDDMLAKLSAEDTPIVASYRPNMQSEPVVFRFAMTGAKEGLEALKPTAADAAEPKN